MAGLPLLQWIALLGCVVLAVGLVVRRQRSAVASTTLALLFSLAMWNGGLVWAEIASGASRTVALRASMLGMYAAMGLWLLLALRYRWPMRMGSAAVAAMATMPVAIFFIGVVTNASHGWFVLPGRDWDPGLGWAGPATHALSALTLAYGLVAGGIFAFAGIRTTWRGEWRPGIALTVAILSMPWVTSAGRADAESTIPIAAASLTLTTMVLALTALRYQLLEPPPLGHREVIDHLRHGVLMANSSGEILDHNPAAERLLGASPRGRAIGDAVAEIAVPESRESVRDTLFAVRASSRPLAFPLEAVGGRALEISARTITSDDGQSLGQVATLRDRSEEKRFGDAALRSEKLETLGTLAAGIAHEVNNPLAFVRANLGELARLGALIDEYVASGRSRLAGELLELGPLARSAQQSLERIQQAVSDVRRLAAAPNGADEVFSIDTVVQDAVALARRRAGSLEIETRLAPDLPLLSGSVQLLVQAVLGLLLDVQRALRETPEPRIEVETGADDGTVFVRVRDNGPGVPEALAGRTFADSVAGLPDASRVGLGLSVAAGIAHDHGGSLHTEADVAGGGYLLRLAVPSEC